MQAQQSREALQQPTYGRKANAIEGDRETILGLAASSSSPSRLSESSASRFEQGDIMRDEDRSCNTTVSSDDDEMEEDGVAMSRKHALSTRKPVLFLSDDDEEDADGDHTGDEENAESDAAFLKRFRESRAARQAGVGDKAKEIEALPSSSLTDPPTASSGIPTSSLSVAVSGASLVVEKELVGRSNFSLSPASSPSPRKGKQPVALPHSLETSSQSQASLPSSPYITEAQKQSDERSRKDSRESKVKELARRKAKGRESQISECVIINEEIDDEVESSTSDIQEEVGEEDELPSAIQAAQIASNNRRKADDRKKAEQEAKKMSKKSKAGKGVLQMRADDDSDSDLDFNSRKVLDKGVPVKALSKKEEEEMHRTQARIERELKANQAKSLRSRGERPVYGLTDLLSSFDDYKEASVVSKPRTTKGVVEDPNNSDPIESASEEEVDGMGKSKDHPLLPQNSSHGLDRFTPVLKELSPISAGEADHIELDEDLPDALEATRRALENRARREKLAALKERKVQAMLMSMKRSDEGEADDDDFLLIDSKSKSSAFLPLKPTIHFGRKQRKVNKQGSPGGPSEGESEDDSVVTDSQVHRTGKALNHSVNGPQAAGKDVPPTIKKGRGSKAKETLMTAEKLNENIIKRARLQNIELRRKREAAFGRKKESQQKQEGEKGDEKDADLVRRLREALEKGGEHVSEAEESEGEGSEYNPDGVADDEEAIDLGSGEEDEEEEQKDDAIETEEESDEESNDSEKENSAPASQESVQPRMPRRPRITLDDEEEEEGMVAETSSRNTAPGRSPLQPISVGQEVEKDGERDQEDVVPLEAILESSSQAGLSQFFQDTQVPAVHIRPQTSSSPPRNISSTLGKFFEDTQSDQPVRGESFPVLGNLGDDSSAMPGFSQFFNEGTQMPMPSTSHLMPPPSTSAKGLSLLGGTDQDAFAALRKAQASEAQDLYFDVDQLPSLEEGRGMDEDDLAALEMEALQAEIEERQSKDKKKREEENITYINKDGFFTQTKPEFERYSLSQSQSQSQSQRNHWEDAIMEEFSLESRVEQDDMTKKRKRFRRAVSIDEEQEEELMQASTNPDSIQEVAEEERDMEETSLTAPLNAFDVLKGAVQSVRRDETPTPPVGGQKNRFVQGEAEESEDEEEGPAGKKQKAGRGGLGGVFSDDEEGSNDEEEEEEDDGKDLEELIDEEKDEEEAEKDILARQRYLKDIDADDEAALALHEKAARGGLRSKRRAVNLDGTLEGFLDDDYEDEWLERKVKNPYGNIAKKRKLQGKDGLDLLEANEESQAFVRKYRETHEKETDLDKYAFLLPVEGDEEGQEHRTEEDSNEDEEQEQGQTMSHQQFRQELEERRKRKRQAINLSDDEDDAQMQIDEDLMQEQRRAEEEERMMKKIQRDIYGHSSDEDDDDEDSIALPSVRDRLREAHHRSSNDIRRAGYDDDDEAEHAFSALNRIASTRALTEGETIRLAQLQSEFANEPEWGHQDGYRKISSNRNSSASGGSVTSFGKQQAVTRSARAAAVANKTNSSSNHLHRVRSKLSDVMSRQSQFSESQED